MNEKELKEAYEKQDKLYGIDNKGK